MFGQDEISISNLHSNDSTGVSIYNGQTVKVTGVLTTAKNFGTSGPAFIQDNTGGVSVYGTRFTNYVAVGDSITLTSKIVNYNGLTQFDFSTGTFTRHSTGNIVEPMIITIDQIKNQSWNGVEEFEGRLVRLSDVKVNQTGNFAGNTTYTITDSVNTMDLRIDSDVSSIVGTVIPQSKIDIIGIVGQYKSSAPYNSGYQLMPRSISDIVTLYVPVINSLVVTNMTENSFTVAFNTVRLGNTEIAYGKTTSLELGTLVNADLTTSHSISVLGLEKDAKYYYKVYSRNEYGVSESVLQTITLTISTTSSGKMNVYFNSPVDNSVAIPGNLAEGSVDFKAKLLQRINNASSSIDIALYSFFGMDDIATAIIAAKNRGVKVRIVYDSRTTQSSMKLLLNAGIPISKRPTTIDGIMHNKFAIFDARDFNAENDWVWTGSWNWTSTELYWRNNVIEINDKNLALNYMTEFEEMWGSNTDEPNSANAKFGSHKTDNTIHNLVVNNIPVESYFSPSDNTGSKISNTILTADSSLYFALLLFTSEPIYNAINTDYSSGLRDIRGVIDDIEASGSNFVKMQSLGEMFDYNLSNVLHHKYGVIDASYPTSDPTVITGSHNWTDAANQVNDENTLIIHDVYIANKYMQEFKKRYNDLGGVVDFVVPVVSGVNDQNYQYPKTLELNQNYPNPFNPVTTITFFVPFEQKLSLCIYNAIGEKVKEIFNGTAKAGLNVFDFNASNFASGVYIYQLRSENKILSKKLVLLK